MNHWARKFLTEKMKPCEHLKHIEEIKGAQRHECFECVKIGAWWVHLRPCQNAA